MSVSDFESEGAVSGKAAESLEVAGRELVHDVATPLATIQLNLQALSNYLPKLMAQCQGPAGTPSSINPEHRKALASLPSALEDDIRKICHAVQLFSAVLVPGSRTQIPPRSAARLPQDRTLLRVLLVEDELIHQEIALKQLRDRGTVDVAATGREALDLVAKESYDLVLLDLMLSGRDARGLVGDLRAAGGEDLRIILVSNMPLGVDDVRQLEVDGALEKPFRLVSLEALLEALSQA